MLPNAKNGTVDIGGSQMCYARFGRGEKTMILLPGLSDGLATVRGKAFMLSLPYKIFFEKYTVYMFSRRDDLPIGHTIRDMADDQSKAMKQLGIDRACIVGVSQGGMIAQTLAVYHPERVEKLVLVVTAPYANSIAKTCVTEWMDMAKRGDHKALMCDTAERSYSEKKLKSYRHIYPVLGIVGKPKSYSRFLINANAILSFDILADLPKIKAPTLIIGGKDDKIVGVDASYELHEQIPNSEIMIYPDLGHALYEEAGGFNGRVFEFLESRKS